MDLFQALSELIDLRSFSNVWFWIALAVVWSLTSHWILGVPFDMLLRARRDGGQAALDLEDMVRISVNRRLAVNANTLGWNVASACFGLTVLLLLGFGYGLEFAQAAFLLAFPLAVIAVLNRMAARRIREADVVGPPLYALLSRHRRMTQFVGLLTIFVTTIWGMYQNISQNPLGG
ncbi:MAG: component of SufBCD complex [Pseudomonadota bacterium]